MSTLQGAIVRVENADRFREVAARHQIVVTDASGPWVLIEVAPRLGKLGPPPFAQALSRELDTSVLAFFVQSSTANERLEHWEKGQRVRELEFYLDGGGWIARAGEPQAWEAAYFFADDKGTGKNEDWPSNLGDEVSEDDIRRYEAARSKRVAEPVMDLLMGGDISRLCKFYGVSLGKPGAQYEAPRKRRMLPWFILILTVLVGALFLGWRAAN